MQRISLLLLCAAAAACGKAKDDDKPGAAPQSTGAGSTAVVPAADPGTATGSASDVVTGTGSDPAVVATVPDSPLLSAAQLADQATYVTFSFETNGLPLCNVFTYYPAKARAECSGPAFVTAIDVPADVDAPLLAALKDIDVHEFAPCVVNGASEYSPSFSVNGAAKVAVGRYDAAAGWTCQDDKPHGIIAATPPEEGGIPFLALLQGAFKPALAAAAAERPLMTAAQLAADATTVTFTFEINAMPKCDWYTYKPVAGAAACGLFPNMTPVEAKTVAGAPQTALNAALGDLNLRTVESCPDTGTREYFPHLTLGGLKYDVGTYAAGAWGCTSGDNDHVLISRTTPTGAEPEFFTLLKAQFN